MNIQVPSVLWLCWLGGRKGIQPVKSEWWGAGMVIRLEWGANLHTAQLMPLPLTASCFSKIQMVLAFWYRLTRGSPGQKAVKRVYVYVCIWIYTVSQKTSTFTSDRWGGQICKIVKFSQYLTYQKLLKSVNFWQSYSKNKKVDVFGTQVYTLT